jgi:hypothetical protein
MQRAPGQDIGRWGIGLDARFNGEFDAAACQGLARKQRP